MPALPPEDEAWMLLHDIRLRGLVEAPDRAQVATLIDAGLIVRKRTFLALTPEGREVHTAWVRLAQTSPGYDTVRRAYEAFLPVNTELIRACSDWQVHPGGVPNDHTDPRYDWGVIDRLRALDERAGAIVRRLAKALPRFAGYRARLRAALQRVEEGEHDWFASPRVDSYHTVWMQLHEDLLVTLGLERADEQPRPS